MVVSKPHSQVYSQKVVCHVRSNLPLEVNCPPDTTLKQTVRPGHFTSKESTPFEVDCPPCKGTFCFEVKCPGDNLLRSGVSGGQFTSK